MVKTVKISFYASVDEAELKAAEQKLWIDGTSVIQRKFPMLENVRGFSVEEDPLIDDENK